MENWTHFYKGEGTWHGGRGGAVMVRVCKRLAVGTRVGRGQGWRETGLPSGLQVEPARAPPKWGCGVSEKRGTGCYRGWFRKRNPGQIN